MYTYMYIHIYIRIHICIHSIYVYIHIQSISKSISISIYIYVYTYVYVSIYIPNRSMSAHILTGRERRDSTIEREQLWAPHVQGRERRARERKIGREAHNI